MKVELELHHSIVSDLFAPLKAHNPAQLLGSARRTRNKAAVLFGVQMGLFDLPLSSSFASAQTL